MPPARPSAARRMPPLERGGELRIGVPVEVEQARLRVVARRQQLLRRPRHHRRLPAHHQRRDRADARWRGRRCGSTRPSDASASSARLSQPRVDRAGPGDAALQHVLAVEVRALAIGRRRGVHDGGLLRLVEPVQVRHRRIEREEGIERQRRRPAVEHQRPIAAQADPVGIADRRHGAQPVERAPQHDDEHARIAAFGARQLGHLGPGEQGAGADQRLAAAGQMAARRSWSPPLELGRHEQQGQRLLPALGAGHGLRRLGATRCEPSTVSMTYAGIDAAGDALGEVVGDVQAPAHAVDPGRLVVGIALGRWRAPQGLAESRLPAGEAGGVGRACRPRAPSRSTHSLGRLSLVRGRAQASGEATRALATSLRSPAVSRKAFASLSTSAGGGSSATK